MGAGRTNVYSAFLTMRGPSFCSGAACEEVGVGNAGSAGRFEVKVLDFGIDSRVSLAAFVPLAWPLEWPFAGVCTCEAICSSRLEVAFGLGEVARRSINNRLMQSSFPRFCRSRMNQGEKVLNGDIENAAMAKSFSEVLILIDVILTHAF